MPLPIPTQSATKREARATMPKAKRRARIPTSHRATTNVWTAIIWSVICQCVGIQNTAREAYESNQCDPKLTDLLNNALCCAIRALRDNPVVGRPNIEATTHGLQNIVHKKGKLSHD